MLVKIRMPNACSRRQTPAAFKVACAVLLVAGALAVPRQARGSGLGDCQPPIAREASLAADKVIECPLTGGQSHTYRLPLAAGQFADLKVEQKGINVIVRVLDPASHPLADYDSESRPMGEEHIGLVADSAGAYQIQVQAKYAHDPVAAYSIELLTIRPMTHQEQLQFKARALSTQSQMQSDAGHYEQALDLSQTALTEAEEALGPNASYVGEFPGQLGAIALIAGDREKAAAAFQRAILIDQAAKDANNQPLAFALLGVGSVYIAASDYAKAEEALQRAVHITEENQGRESPDLASCLVVLSLLHQRRGDFPRALAEIQHALAIDQQRLEPDDRATLKALDSLGDVYFELHDLDHAVPVLQQTLRLTEQKLGPNHPLVAHPLQNLGIIARDQKQFSLSLEYLWRAERVREQALGSQHPLTATLLVNIGNVYSQQGDYRRSTETYLRALSVLERAAGPYHEWTMMTLGNLARSYAAQNDPSDAVRYMARMNAAAETNLSLNLAIGSEHDRLDYADKFAFQTSRTISLNLSEAPNDPAAANLAAEIILQRKGRVLDAVSDSMRNLRRRLQPEDQELLNELSDTLAELAKAALHGPGQTTPEVYQAKLVALQRHKEELETEISRRSAGYYQRTDAVTLAAVRKAIPADSVLIEFCVHRPYDFRQLSHAEDNTPLRYVVYLIPPQGDVRWKDLGDAKEIDNQIDAYRQTLRDPKRADARQLARALDAKLMQPMRALGIEGKHLIISPDGELNLLSFESLLDEQGRYLIEDYPISYVTTGRDLLRMEVARTGRSEPVVVANPSFGDPEAAQLPQTVPARLKPASAVRVGRGPGSGDKDLYFAPLAGTALEARELKSLFPEAKILTGTQASKAELEQIESPSILHIATHGFFLQNAADEAEKRAADKIRPSLSGPSPRGVESVLDVENPLLRSGLALAGANFGEGGNEKGILTALEASNLNLWGTKLVTLSACDTGVGEVRNGEGVYGLRRAFFIAGAETVVMSLWPVSDSVTRELMTSYYRGLKAGLGRGDALRQAQLAMLHRNGREHPFYWASFIQVGEWANLEENR
jgi:CHAT domain-containing protein/tetratricopeptide (TPR) repeat protein